MVFKPFEVNWFALKALLMSILIAGLNMIIKIAGEIRKNW
jgi:hypothetical protein